MHNSAPDNKDTPTDQFSLDHSDGADIRSPEKEDISLAWENRIRILQNPDVWKGVLMTFGISCLLGAILFFAISKSPWAFLVSAGAFTFFIALFLLIGFVVDLFGGFQTRFALTSLGVRSIAGRGAKAAANAAFWAGVLTGNAGAAGAGILARSEQNNFVTYQDVTQVKLRPRRRYIRVKGGFMEKPIALYCLPDNYAQAETILRRQCSRAKFF